MDGPNAVNYVALAVPAMLSAIALEAAVGWKLGRRIYRPTAAMSDVACGMVQQLAMMFARGLLASAYAFVFLHARVWTLEGPWVWVAGFLGLDCLHYWWHRMSHQVNVLWAAHVVHHQSEDFNLAVALRHSVFTPFTALPFYLPLAIVGVPPHVYAASHAAVVLYQFWVHTELVGPLPRLERVLITPSVHRVHHALNAAYVDRNFGGVFTVWDRLFGTYAVETEKPVYGASDGLHTFGAVRVQLDHFVALARRAARLGSPLVWLKSPMWSAPEEHHEEARPRVKYDPPVRDLPIAAALYAIALASTTLLMLFAPRFPRPFVLGAAPLIVALLGFAIAIVTGAWRSASLGAIARRTFGWSG